MSQVDLAATAPTQFQDIGGVSLAYRHFGKEGAPPVVCFQHFTGTINNFDPIHTNRLAQDRPVILVDYRGVGRSGGEMPDSIPATAADIIAFVKALDLELPTPSATDVRGCPRKPDIPFKSTSGNHRMRSSTLARK